MSTNDATANALSKIMNTEKIGKKECDIFPPSKVVKDILKIFNGNGYIGEFSEEEDSRGNWLKINLLGNINKCGVIKPRFPVSSDGFEKFEKRYLPASNMGIIIVSTNQGIITHEESKKKKIGGKLLAYCY